MVSTRPAEPDVLTAAKERLTAELEHAWRQKRSRGPEPDPVLEDPAILDALMQMTAGTCAYCERSLTAQGSDGAVVTHHRPTWGAVGSHGDVDLTAYWWLTYEWDNLYAACSDCIRSRGSRFPVAGPRAGRGQPLSAEQPLLLDPILDQPDEHLRFQSDGTVTAFTERGLVACDLLALNRDALVKARLAAIGGDGDTTAFASMHRQLGTRPHETAKTRRPPIPEGPDLPSTSGAEPGLPSYNLNDPMGEPDLGHYFQATQWIERVVIRNFRPIRELEIDLARSTSERGPWTVLLGENGCGKSSVLHAIALTMMGGEQRRRLGIDARRYLRDGAHKGLVQVYLSGRTDPLELRWASGDTEFTGPEPVAALLLGYGAVRLLPRTPSTQRDDQVVRVDNLFDPLAPLTDPSAWLGSLDDDTFDDVAGGIHEMLALDHDAELVRGDDRVVLRQGRSRSDIVTLSDGYQSMVVMACDILRATMRLWSSSALAEGIVLVDEIGAHLHPRWRLRIVTAMRNLMPRMQFIVTTHDPLCLRGIVDGEVVVIRRNSEGDVVSLTDLPPVTGMRIDQLLTSEHFGLGSTDDPEITELWESYYRLMALKSLGEEQRERLDRVRRRLDELEQFGSTERERLLLTSAADYIARRREGGDAAAPTSAEMTAKMADLWRKYLPGGA
ncbi:TIGR02646 family protein [Tessaracoccus bendigoensis DSM 12906]|uniref:TIGR02646 family protein n=1 Tax=Tessaracoccus bendigoensis DSM 12906 TaxID=1123357 RepID=A0A1M6E2R3_9ACTN|nr:AAA family ATPase [Tessaracoccus bendigoensis]SHI79741.1 TIGR02646 family protein [Tessaracoccus bendigoensis DSM 12906]